MIQPFFTRLLSIDNPDEEVRRRGRNVVIIALGLIVLCLCFLALLPLQPTPGSIYMLIVVAILIYVGVVMLARSGRVTRSALVCLAMMMLALLGSIWASQQIMPALYFFVLPLLVAGLCLRPWQVWVVLAFNIAALLAVIAALPQNPFNDPSVATGIYGGIFLLGIVALMGYLGANSTSTTLKSAGRARREAEAAAQALSHANADLEATIAERTAALQSALAESQARAAEQTRLLEEVEQQRSTILDLSVPVIPISSTTLVMPLVGSLDSARLAQIQEQALYALQRSSARYLVVDVTGVPLIDSLVAQGLLAVVQAVRLLGSEVILVGIRPEVAQAIVGLGLNLQGMRTTRDLQSALHQLLLN